MTGEITIEKKDDEPIGSVSMFNLALEHFRHLVRVKDYLSEGECHALSVWITTQLVLDKKLTIVERSFKKLMEIMIPVTDCQSESLTS